jgi:pimeloyl-ACP methyl ester carboxylesterase
VTALRVVEEGTGPPVVLVHGLGSSHRSWHRVAAAMAATHRVLAVDMPGFGGSPAAGDGFRPVVVAAAIVEALDARGVTTFDLVGHSLGGLVSAHLADRHRDRVRRLVLIAPAGLEPRLAVPAGIAGGVVAAAVRVRREIGSFVVERAPARAVMFGRIVHDPHALDPADGRIVLEASRGATRIPHGVHAALHGDIRPLLGRLPMPVDLVWGAEDRLLAPSGIGEALRVRPDLAVHVIADCGHLPMLERPAALEAILRGALEGAPSLP